MPFIPISVDPSFYGSGAVLPAAAAATAIGFGSSQKYETMSIAPIHPRTGELLDDERAFQFWPESIQDSIEIGWSFKEIPGASHGLAEWGSNGGRTLSFEVPVVRTMLYANDQPKFAFLSVDPQSTATHDLNRLNEGVAAFIMYMRSFCYPIQDNGVVISPPISALCCPNMRLNEDGSDVFYGVMTGCDVTYERLFQNGEPSVAKLSLSFKQVVQVKDEAPYQFAYNEGMRVVSAGLNRGAVARRVESARITAR